MCARDREADLGVSQVDVHSLLQSGSKKLQLILVAALDSNISQE